MCVYCYCGDWAWRHDPPWNKPQPYKYPSEDNPWKYVPEPANPYRPIKPWALDKLKEYEDMLKRIKELEDQVGCPCEPNKADYLELFRQRIESLEKQLDDKKMARVEYGWFLEQDC